MSDATRWGNIQKDPYNGKSSYEKAQERADAQSAAIRRPAEKVLGADVWKPGQYNKVEGMKNQFHGELKKYIREQEASILPLVESFLRRNYTPPKPITDEVYTAATQSLGRIIMVWAWYMYSLPYSLRQQRSVLDYRLKCAVAQRNQQAETQIKAQIAAIGQQELPLMTQLLRDYLRGNCVAAEVREINIAAGMINKGCKIEDIIQAAVKEDIARISYLLPYAQAVDGAKLSDAAFNAIWWKLNKFWGKESDMDLKKEIEALQSERKDLISTETADALVSALSTSDKIHGFLALCSDVEWSNGHENLKAELDLLKAFLAYDNARYTLISPASKVLETICQRIQVYQAAISYMNGPECIGYSMEDIAQRKHLK